MRIKKELQHCGRSHVICSAFYIKSDLTRKRLLFNASSTSFTRLTGEFKTEPTLFVMGRFMCRNII